MTDFFFPAFGRKILLRLGNAVHLDPDDLLGLHEMIQMLTALQADPRSVHPLMQSIVTGVRTNDLFSALKVNPFHLYPVTKFSCVQQCFGSVFI